MTDSEVTIIPPAHSTAYRIAALIHEQGAMSSANIFRAIEYNPRPHNRRQLIADQLQKGWLIQSGDKIGISHRAIEHFERLVQQEAPESSAKFVGQVACARDTGSVYDRPPLSKRYSPNVRGFRADVPEFSARDHQSFFTQA